jgi:dipeptidyl aminopeptidase/acylaminoacyl peptidase
MTFIDLQTRRDTLLFATGDYLVSYDWFSDDYHIAFDQVCSMMMMNRDGTGITTLYISCTDDAPVVRPGNWALAHHNNQGLVVTDSLGVNRRQIPNTQTGDHWASWSPDGQWIAFVRVVNDTLHNYYKVHPDGTGLTALTSFTTTRAVFYNAGAWTPDGSKIVVAASINGVRGLYAIATDGSRGRAILPGTAGVTVDFVGNVTGNINITLTDVADGKQPQVLPTQYKLEQNYPNPFNPSTIIKFQVPSSNLVSLKVYDILGREVATLVNEVKQPGSYEVTWNATAYASGVYFYRLKAGDFAQTKKLLLLR